jgi:hypothetical protein
VCIFTYHIVFPCEGIALAEKLPLLLTPLTYFHVGHAEDGQQGKQDLGNYFWTTLKLSLLMA